MTLKEFFIKIGLKIDEAQFKKLDAVLEGAKKAAKAFGVAFIAAGASLGVAIKSTTDQAAEITKLSQVMGVNTDVAQQWGYATNKTGVDIDDLTQLAAELGENIGEAAGGTGEAAEAFKTLGIKTKDTKGNLRAIDEVLFEIADKMKALPDGTKKAGAITGLFGEEGIKLLPLLNQGSGAIRQYMSDADAMGVTMGKDAVKAGAALSAQFNDLWLVIKVLGATVAGPFMTQLSETIKEFFEWYKVNKGFVAQRLDRVFKVFATALKPVVIVLGAAVSVAAFLIDHFWTLAAILGGVLLAALILNTAGITTVVLGYIAAGAAGVASGLATAAAWALANLPLIAMAALFALIILIAMDIYGWLNGQDSLIGTIIEKWKAYLKDWLEPTEDDGYLMRALKKVIAMLLDLENLWDNIVTGIKQLWNGMIDFMSEAFWNLIYAVRDGVKDTLNMIPGVQIGGHSSAVESVGKLKSFNNRFKSIQSGEIAPTPSEAVGNIKAKLLGGGSPGTVVNPQFNSNITIQGVEDSDAAAAKVDEANRAFWDQKMRELAEVT